MRNGRTTHLLLCFGLILIGRSSLAAEPPAFSEVCFDDFDDREPWPAEEELKKVLGRVSGASYDISKSSKDHWSGSRPATRISGTFRLNMPWKANHALRLSVVDPDNFRLHLWRGQQGVTLRYYREFVPC